MTDSELDAFLIKILTEIESELLDCIEYAKNYSEEDFDEIKEEYQRAYEEMKNLLDEINGIDDLAEMDEEIITDVYEYIADYASNFVISEAGSDQNQKDEEKYSKVEELLYLFLDEDEEEI